MRSTVLVESGISVLTRVGEVYATGRSKAMALVLFSYFVFLCGFYYGAFHIES